MHKKALLSPNQICKWPLIHAGLSWSDWLYLEWPWSAQLSSTLTHSSPRSLAPLFPWWAGPQLFRTQWLLRLRQAAGLGSQTEADKGKGRDGVPLSCCIDSQHPHIQLPSLSLSHTHPSFLHSGCDAGESAIGYLGLWCCDLLNDTDVKWRWS